MTPTCLGCHLFWYVFPTISATTRCVRRTHETHSVGAVIGRLQWIIEAAGTGMDDEHARDNRVKKTEGRAKRRRFVQGTRAYTHALTNSIARRAAEKMRQEEEDRPRT